MKNIFLSVLLCGLPFILEAQNASVEKSIYGIQTGFLGVWGHNESKLSNSIAFRTEIGLDSGFWGGDYYKKTGFLMTPVITAEPRWYYNLNKRVSKSKRVTWNTGSFLSMKVTYHPDWFVISNTDNVRVISDVSIIPTLGIRRHIWKYITYETGIGIGHRYIFAKQAGFYENESEVAVNLHLRVGYRF